MQAALRENVGRKQYISGCGLPDLRQAVEIFCKKEFGYNYSCENIIIGPGSKELIFQLLYLLEGPLMVPAPSWVSYGPQAKIRSKNFIPITTNIKNGYRLQAEEFESRLFGVDKLIEMGAQIILCDPHRAVVSGPTQLKGARVSSPDIRAGMALLIAALGAKGTTEIQNIDQIDRGYENIEQRLNDLGAKIQRVIE